MRNKLVFYIGLGIAFGCSIRLVLGNIALGIGIGAFLGISFFNYKKIEIKNN